MENLWPKSLEKIEPIETPKNILDEQALFLNKLTNEMIYGYTENTMPQIYFYKLNKKKL